MVRSRFWKLPYTIDHTPCIRVRSVKRGFTLIELVIAIGVFGILGALTAGILINVMRSHNKAQIISQLERTGNTALAAMGNEIRGASSVSPSGTTTTITIENGSAVTFSLVTAASGNGYVSRHAGAMAASPITDHTSKTGVNVESLYFFVNNDADPPLVRITITISQSVGVGARIDFDASVDLETTVTLRSY